VVQLRVCRCRLGVAATERRRGESFCFVFQDSGSRCSARSSACLWLPLVPCSLRFPLVQPTSHRSHQPLTRSPSLNQPHSFREELCSFCLFPWQRRNPRPSSVEPSPIRFYTAPDFRFGLPCHLATPSANERV
jgi:hypothetical protein